MPARAPAEVLRRGGIGAVLCPLVDFFARYPAAVGFLILAFMCVYRLTEFAMGSMANSFYIDHGYSLTQIGTVVQLLGLPASLFGVVLGGALVARIGLARSLLAGSVLIMSSNLGFSLLATTHAPVLLALGTVNGLDNLAQGVHGTALIAFLSSLTSPRYTATQYALFSSVYALLGKILEGYSGRVVDVDRLPGFLPLHRRAEHPGSGAALRAAEVSGFRGERQWALRSISSASCAGSRTCRPMAAGSSGSERGDWPLRGFVVRVSDGVRAYVNRCAHLDYPLNYLPHEFLTHDRSMILCYVHGAIFEKATGYCVAGPCSGLSLHALPVRIESGYVLLADEADVQDLATRFA